VIPVTVHGDILWNGSEKHKQAIDEVSRLVRVADRTGKSLLSNDAMQEVVEQMGYVGHGSSENVVVYDPQHLERM
jgi:hypothetical protein